MGKILYRIVERFRKGFDKGTAAGGACFVELDAVYGLVLDLDALHILSADVQDAVHVRLKERSGVVMGYGLYFPFIQQKGSLDQRFTVAGGAGVDDLHTLRKLAVDVLDSPDGGAQGIPFIVMVKRVQQCSVFAHQCGFRGGGAGIDAQKGFSLIGGKVLHGNLVPVMAADKCLVFFGRREQRFHPVHFKFHPDLAGQPFLKLPKGHLCRLGLCVERGADGGKQVGLVRDDGMLVVQLQGADKSLTQLG